MTSCFPKNVSTFQHENKPIFLERGNWIWRLNPQDIAMAGWNEQTDRAIVSANDAVHICLSDVYDSAHVHLYHTHSPVANNNERNNRVQPMDNA